MKIKFSQNLVEVGKFNGIGTIDEFNNENSICSGSLEYSLQHGGPLLKRILSSYDFSNELKVENHYPVIDCRVQRLMVGMYPSIPGWHCDGVPRGDYHAQPDFTKVNPKVVHFTTLIATSENVSNTEFVTEDIEVDVDENQVWKTVHQAVEKMKPKTMKITPGVLYRFNQLTIHRTTPTIERGWRLFFRLSIHPNKPMNIIPKQQQVYILSEENGW